MKFSLVAILPAVLWTVMLLLAGGRYDNADSQAGAYMITAALWFGTAAVLFVYWAARIVRFVMRGAK